MSANVVLRPWSRFAAAAMAAAGAAALAIASAAFAATTPAAPPSAATGTARAAAKLDINGASKASLARLGGIGEEYAGKIIAGRPYKSAAELESRKILPKDVYDKIAPLIIAHTK